MRTLLFIVALAFSSAWCQEAPVTRAEFSALFTSISRGYVADETVVVPKAFAADETPVTKEDVAAAMLVIAIARGKATAGDGTALARLASNKVLPADAVLFTSPGLHFRPSDLVMVTIAFADAMAGRPTPKSAGQPALTTPGIRS